MAKCPVGTNLKCLKWHQMSTRKIPGIRYQMTTQSEFKLSANAKEVLRGLDHYIRFYNTQRPYQALGYRTPAEVFSGDLAQAPEQRTERRWSASGALAGKTAGPSLNIAPILSNRLGPPYRMATRFIEGQRMPV